MTGPDWLAVGTDLVDEDGDRWLIRDVQPGRVRLQNPDRGVHELRTEDLIAWVRTGRWEVLS